MENNPAKSKMAAALIVSKMKPKDPSGIEGAEAEPDEATEGHDEMCGEDIMSALEAKDPKALAKAIKALGSY